MAGTQQAEQDGWSYLIWRAVFWVLGSAFRAAWRLAITLSWFVVLMLVAASEVVLALVAVLGIGIAVASYWVPVLRKFAPFVADWYRYKKVLGARKQSQDALEFLFAANLISEQDLSEKPPKARMFYEKGTIVFELKQALRGVPPHSFVAKAKEFEALLDAKRSVAEPLSGGGVRITFYLTDPLDEAVVRTEVGAFDPEKMSVACAINSFGEERSITFGDSSGMVVGGIPGSGKTAGLTSFLLPMALSEYVDLSIIDGKGGADWTNYSDVAQTFISGDDDLVPIRDFLRDFYEEMVSRVATMKDLIGNSNFWNISAAERLAAGLRFKLLVIDECQGVFETAGRSKEEKELLGEIFRYLSAIVKRGRSAGFFAVFITQKPTAEALPTAIRDNAGLRIAFRLQTSQAENAVLGVSASDGIEMPRAVEIPASRKGGAVIGTDSGGFEAVRFFYIPEKEQEQLLSAV